MAFPVPSHLPKRAVPVDVSSKILYKISGATNETLNASLAASWVNELNESIQSTKQHIHNRINEDLPTFNQLLESSKGVQKQFEVLVEQVDGLHHSLSDPKEGLVPNLLERLRTHKALAQEASDAETVYQSFSYLLKLRDAYSSLLSLSEGGHLPEATRKAAEVDSLIQAAPQSLQNTAVIDDLRSKFRATRNRVEDLLSDAYLQGITITPLELVIRPIVQARNSEVSLELSAVIRSLPTQALANHTATFRRDFLAHFVEHVLKQPFELEATSSATSDQKLTLVPSPPNVEDLASRLSNLGQVLHFLSSHILSLFPSEEANQLARSLAKSVTTLVLDQLIRPALPSSFGLLPGFLTLLKTAVDFERTEISPLSGNNSDLAIKTWADGVSGHYERRRRVEILEQARMEILEKTDFKETFLAVSNDSIETSLPSVLVVQDDTPIEEDAWGFDEPLSAAPPSANPVASEAPAEQEQTDGWGFDDDPQPLEAEAPTNDSQEADSWGFDDDMEEEPTTPDQPSLPRAATPTLPKENGHAEDDVDAAAAWGWNDEQEGQDEPTVDEEVSDDTNPWDDDPWADPPPEEDAPPANPQPSTKPPLSPVATFTSPKVATRLEKLASKQKKANGGISASQTPEPSPGIQSTTTTTPTSSISHNGNGHIHSVSSTPKTPNPPPPSTPPTAPSPAQPAPKPSVKRPADVITNVAPKEYYQVPKVIKRVVKMVEKIIDESKLFYASNLFPDAKDTNPAPGAILAQTASSILDLYEALYPIKYHDDLKQPERGMLFSNGCFYVAGAIQRIEDTLYGASTLKERLIETRKHLEILANSWFENVIEQQQQHVDKLLADGAQGFVSTTDQDRYDECEMAVSRTVSDIKKLAQRLDGVLTKSRYYPVLGLVTEAALSKTLQDILAIPDITEVESGRLAELCRIFNSLEGLFCQDPSQASFVVAYVPSWLKFSYLSELLEASLADITYLVENDALVDFHVDELIGLVKALFADTQLRTNAINKIKAGHSAYKS